MWDGEGVVWGNFSERPQCRQWERTGNGCSPPRPSSFQLSTQDDGKKISFSLIKTQTPWLCVLWRISSDDGKRIFKKKTEWRESTFTAETVTNGRRQAKQPWTNLKGQDCPPQRNPAKNKTTKYLCLISTSRKKTKQKSLWIQSQFTRRLIWQKKQKQNQKKITFQKIK